MTFMNNGKSLLSHCFKYGRIELICIKLLVSLMINVLFSLSHNPYLHAHPLTPWFILFSHLLTHKLTDCAFSLSLSLSLSLYLSLCHVGVLLIVSAVSVQLSLSL